ncbi:MAG: hypothetical protein IJP74_04790 [Prevotella sp.]|nr:hypothetical protein [Prevotella sp.]
MKKFMMTLAAVFCCAMTTTIFTACGSDDDDNNGSPAERKIVGYQVDYSLNIPQTVYSLSASATCGNLYLLFDKIEVGYIDENGQEQREVVTGGQWSKTVTYKKTLDGYLKLYLTKPASLDVESLPYEKYDQGVTCAPTLALQGVTVIYSDGKKEPPTMYTPAKVSTSDASFAVSKGKLVEYLGIFKDEVKVMSIKLEV